MAVRAWLLVFLCVSARAEPIRIRMAANAPEGTSWASEFHTLAREIRAATKGQVEMKWVLGGIAGDELAALERIKRGQLDGEAGALFCERLAPSLRVGRIVGLFRSREEWKHVMNRLIPDLDREFAKSGFTNLGLGTFGNIILFSRQPLRSIDDVKRVRFWSYDLDELVTATLREIGMTIVPGPIENALHAYDEKSVDGFVSVPSAALAFQWSAYSRFYMDLPIGTLPGCFVIAQRTFDALTLEQQRAVTTAVGKFTGRFEALGRMQDDALLGKLFIKQGLKRQPVDERLSAAFFEAAAVARERLGAKLVPNELLARTTAWLADYRAQHERRRR
jgi:TRAP-type transport system periplasmic protein